LAGWHFEDRNPNQTIEKDYQDYIQKLPSDQKGFVGTVHFFADGAGQHAIRIEVFEKNRNAAWQHVIIYDKEDIRIRVVRCGYHRYQS
jgi:hypothetical protein